jgi:adenylate cyclase
MQPQDITTFLNKFLTPMTDILQNQKATIDKYMGDAIVAFWNAPVDDPAHERNAARAVLEMQAKLADLNAEYRNQNEFIWPDTVKVGIGLNTGICCVGNLGSEQRFSYSMIGDAANLSSRVEGLTKQYAISNLVGSSTAAALTGFACLEADIVSVVGRKAPERIFMLAGDELVARTSAFKKLQSVHDKFLLAYREQRWAQAKSFCKEGIDSAVSLGLHPYYETMLKRIAEYETSPPGLDWEGVYIADEK